MIIDIGTSTIGNGVLNANNNYFIQNLQIELYQNGTAYTPNGSWKMVVDNKEFYNNGTIDNKLIFTHCLFLGFSSGTKTFKLYQDSVQKFSGNVTVNVPFSGSGSSGSTVEYIAGLTAGDISGILKIDGSTKTIFCNQGGSSIELESILVTTSMQVVSVQENKAYDLTVYSTANCSMINFTYSGNSFIQFYAQILNEQSSSIPIYFSSQSYTLPAQTKGFYSITKIGMTYYITKLAENSIF